MTTDFASRWIEKENKFGYAFATKMVRCGDFYLPDEAAPCLSFKDADKAVPICSVYDAVDQWSALETERLTEFRVIGSDGSGNPICTCQSESSVVLLDHEDRFRSTQFVNSSIDRLAECLLAYMGEQDHDAFCEAVQRIDPPALFMGSFWWYEANNISELF